MSMLLGRNTRDLIAPECPICQSQVSNSFFSITFRAKSYLPENISLFYCNMCDFAFASPCNQDSYNNYYQQHVNDQFEVYNLTELDKLRYTQQLTALGDILRSPKPLRILDVGCGRAGLLRMMHKMYASHSYYGYDQQDISQIYPELNFVTSLDNIKGSFDVVILSHILEHYVNIYSLDISSLLSDNGIVYIEVPDAARYAEYKRREYLYNIDRLHINHFSAYSLERYLQHFSMQILDSGTIDFTYKDAELYPALYVIASKHGDKYPSPVFKKSSLQSSLLRYIENEQKNTHQVRNMLRDGVVVYGFGDNFFRAKANNGPLDGLHITAIIDKDYESLRKSAYATDYTFISLEDAVANHRHEQFVVAVSFGGEEIKKELEALGMRDVLLL